MELKLKIETHDNMLECKMLDVRQRAQGMQKEVLPGLTVRYDRKLVQWAFGYSAIIDFTLKIAEGVGAGLIARWLYDKLNVRVVKLEVEGTEVSLSEGEITRILAEKMKKSE
jgi:hypothetical protein